MFCHSKQIKHSKNQTGCAVQKFFKDFLLGNCNAIRMNVTQYIVDHFSFYFYTLINNRNDDRSGLFRLPQE